MGTGAAPTQALEAVVLAAGAGARFGGGKLLSPWEGGLLIDGALRAAFAAPVRSVTVVIGADPRAAGAALAFDPGVRVVEAADHAEGMAASLRAGLASLPEDCAGAFVFLGDMPRVPASVLEPLAAALAAGAAAAAPVWEERRGHPVLLGRELFGAAMGLRGDVGARAVLDRLGPRLALVAAPDDGVLLDVDRPSASPA